MADFSFIPIPPRAIGPAEIQPPQPSAPSTSPAAPVTNFQEKLLQALNQIGAGVDQVGQSTPTFQDMQKAMEQAKSAFTETMQAHQLMQSLMKNPDLPTPPPGGTDSGSQEP